MAGGADFATAGVQAGAVVLDYLGKQDALRRQDEQIKIARENMYAQNALQQQMMQQQREMQIATQTDAEGNKLIYDPQRGWMPLLSERGLQRQAAGQAGQDIDTRNYFGRGQYEDQQAAARRQGEGGEARRLLDEISNRYGAPTKEGVEGAQRVYDVTAATEPAEALKRGASAATLRTGGSPTALATGYNALDKAATTGVRTALAKPLTGQADAAFADWRNNRLTPLKAHTAGAAAPGTAPPDSGTAALSAQIAARAARPMPVNPYAGAAANAASKQLTDAMKYESPGYGTMFGAFGKSLTDLFKDKGSSGGVGQITRSGRTGENLYD